MGIINEKIKIKITCSNVKKYKNLNYECEIGDEIYVNVFDLPNHSKEKVNCICDFCGIKFQKEFRVAIKNKHGVNCKKCRTALNKANLNAKYGQNVNSSLDVPGAREKLKKTSLERYGTENAAQSQQIKDKAKKHFLDKYGVQYPGQAQEIKEKQRKTNLERYGNVCSLQGTEQRKKSKETLLKKYGVEHALQVDEFKEKAKNTTFDRYGVEYATQSKKIIDKIKINNNIKYGTDFYVQTDEFKNNLKKHNLETYGYEYGFQIPEFREKAKITCLKKYGFEFATQSEEFKERVKKTNIEKYGVENPGALFSIRSKNGLISISKQQIYLSKLFNGKLNVPILNKFMADIVLDNNILIEYDGGGHYLGVKLGKDTMENAIEKEHEREQRIIKAGYKVIRIISLKDKLPSDEILLELLEKAKNISSSVVKIDIDNSKLTFNDYEETLNLGKLRSIKKEDISWWFEDNKND